MRRTLTTLILAALPAIFSAGLAGAQPRSPEQELLAKVKQHPLAKLGPWLINLHEEYERHARAAAPGSAAEATFDTRNPALRVFRGRVAVEGLAHDPVAFRATLAAVGATNVRGGGTHFSAEVPVSSLPRLAADPALRSAAPILATTNALPEQAVSQGVQSLFGEDGRDVPAIDGTGVRVGVLSDSFGCEPGPFLPGAPTSTVEEDIAGGELPEDLVIAAEIASCVGAIDEGRGMAQIVHDVAPGASQAFHTAFNGYFDFACGIMELAGIATEGAEAACGTLGGSYAPLEGDEVSDVIVDDVIYFAEPMFMPGPIAQGADAAFAAGVPYFSSAGNNARDSYEAGYDEVVVSGNFGNNLNRGAGHGPNELRVHDFGGGDTTQTITMQQSGGAAFAVLSFQWDQPHLSATAFGTLFAGGTLAQALAAPRATTDMDVLFYDEKGILVPLCPPGVATGITCQITGTNNLATGDAVDLAALFFTGPRPEGTFQIRITRSAGSDAVEVVKYVFFELAGEMIVEEHDTESGTAYGHANAAGAASIGAAAWYATVEWADNPADPFGLYVDDDGAPRCDPACAEDFSSAGEIPMFFDALGNRLATPVVRENPWVTGPDGGNTTFFTSDSSFDDDDGDGLNNPFSTFLTPLDPDPASEYPNFFGTSASAPHVAAVAALMLDKNAGLTPAAVYDVLRDTAEDMSLRVTHLGVPGAPIADVFLIADPDPAGFDYDTGWGFVDGDAAIAAVPAP
jgi:hypothetical protein